MIAIPIRTLRGAILASIILFPVWSRAGAAPEAAPPPSGTRTTPGSSPAAPAAPAPRAPDSPPAPGTDAPHEAAPDADRGAPPTGLPVPPEDSEGDRRLGELLALHAAAGPASQVDYLLGLAWSDTEPDESLRQAALRKLRRTESRLVAESIMVKIDDAPARARIGMMQLMGELFSRLGGNHSSLNMAIADQIRYPGIDVARAAIAISSQLHLPDAYLPMREIAGRRDSPLRKEAIIGLSQLGDPRAVDFFKKLLDEDSIPRDEIYSGLAMLGRPSSVLLKSKLDDKDPAERARALAALLRIATVDDLTALYAYVHKYAPEGDAKAQIYDTIATIESRASERPLGGKN